MASAGRDGARHVRRICVTSCKTTLSPAEGFRFSSGCRSGVGVSDGLAFARKTWKITEGETVLIVGAGGGVNTASLQIAKWIGAQVLVVGSDSKKLEMAKSIGADVLIDRSQETDWSKAVFYATNKRGVDVVVDNVGTTFMQSLRSLRKGWTLTDGWQQRRTEV